MADAAPRQSDDTLVGRDGELHAVERGLGETGVLIEGDPGIGKTVLWEAGLALAETAGGRVLRARATPPERRLALTVIEDLLSGEVAEILPSMAPPQRRALRAALLEVDTAVAPDARAISLAFLEALRLLARRGRLVLGVDDVQWLDPASARTLAYALRRLPKDEAVVLATRRTGEEVDASAGLLLRVMDERGIERVGLPPLDESGVATLLRRRLNARLSRPARHRIFELSAGNPLFALELARADKPEPWPSLATSDLPDRLAWAIGTRLRTLPMAVREILAAAALSTAATVDQLTFVLGTTSDAVRDAVGVADGAGIAGLSSSSSVGDDVVAFRHPLFRSAAAELVPPATARTLHARFALAVPDDEEIARHLAAASTTPEAHVADVLHAAARRAASRGALDASAELDLLASRLTPDDQAEERARRAVTAAISLHAAGDRPKAEELLSSRIDGFPPGASRAKAFTALAIMAWNELHRAAELLDRAEREAGDDPWIRSRVLATAAWVEAYGGSLARAAQLSDEAIDLGRRGDDPGLRGALAVRSWVALLRCEDEPADVDLTSSTASGYLRGDHCSPKLCHAMGRRWVGDLPAARALLTEDDDAMAADGAEVGRIEPLAPLAEVLWRLGEWDATASLLEQLGDIGVDAGVPQSRQAQWTHVAALLAAGRGPCRGGSRHRSPRGGGRGIGGRPLLGSAQPRRARARTAGGGRRVGGHRLLRASPEAPARTRRTRGGGARRDGRRDRGARHRGGS